MFVIGKFQLNLTPVINIRFIMHWEGKMYFFDPPHLFIIVNPEIWETHIIKSFISAWPWYHYYLGDAIVCYVNDDIKCIA